MRMSDRKVWGMDQIDYGWSGDDVADFVAQYVDAGNRIGAGDYARRAWGAGVRDELEATARMFAAAHETDLVKWFSPGHAGYDLWMSRNGTGTGYSSRFLPSDPTPIFSEWALGVRRDPRMVTEFDAAAARLQAAAKALGEVWVYCGDDGLLYVPQ